MCGEVGGGCMCINEWAGVGGGMHACIVCCKGLLRPGCVAECVCQQD